MRKITTYILCITLLLIAYNLAYAESYKDIDDFKLLEDKEYYSYLIKDIGAARHSIDIIMYLFKPTGYRNGLPDHILDSIESKHKQGVNVIVLLNIDDRYKYNGKAVSVNDSNTSVAKDLEKRGIRVYFDSPKRITHAKVIIIDKRIVYIGSHNFTQSALKYNHEISVRIVSSDLAEMLLRYMEVIEHEI